MNRGALLKFEFINNASKNLVIIFQSAGTLTPEMFESIQNNTVEEGVIDKAHERYNWFKLTDYDFSDFLFVQDNYSNAFGWYLFDNGKYIFDQINKELSTFIKNKNYERVTSFGSSKGGTAALLFGIQNPYITDVFSLVPQIHVVDYIEKHLSKYKNVMFPVHDEKFECKINQVFFNKKIFNKKNKNTNIFVYTGLNDEQFPDLINFEKTIPSYFERFKIIVNTSDKEHTPMVVSNKRFIYSALRLISTGEELKGPRVKTINDRFSLLIDN